MLKKASSKAAVSEETRRTRRYGVPLSEARTPHGNRRVLARRGWAGEKSGLFEDPAETFSPGSSSQIA